MPIRLELGATRATSHTRGLLTQELGRYLERRVSGRSVLVSGHRGAGKTTLVDDALDLANRAAPASLHRRLLKVPLFGPNLFAPDAKPAKSAKPEPEAKSPSTAPAETPEKDRKAKLDPTQQVLAEFTLALYRSLASEFADAFGRRMRKQSRDSLATPPAELAGQFLLELDEGPSPATLREFWRRANALESGILFTEDGAPGDQAAREIVALASAAQAYRLIIGKVEQSENNQDAVKRTVTVTSGGKIDLKDLLTPMAALAAGALGVAGIAHQQLLPSLAAAGATMAGAVAASMAFERNAKREHSRSSARDYKFIRTMDLDTLTRELPNLIDRIREAGLVPVFVVDELDKVGSRRLKEDLAALIKRLKPLVAERSFFCFLTDRDYFEYIRGEALKVAYPEVYTYFTHRLFVLYSPTDLEKFLVDSLPVVASTEADRKQGEADQLAVTCLLRFRARLHAFDLAKELQRLASVNGQGSDVLQPGKVLGDFGYLFNLIYQLAAEEVLRGAKIANRLEKDAYFGQFVYDVLYYLARRWEGGDTTVKIDLATCRGWLAKRAETAGPAKLALPDADIALLHEQLMLLAHWLATPGELVAKLNANERVRETLSRAVPEQKPLLKLDLTPDAEVAHFRFDYYGSELAEPAVTAATAPAKVGVSVHQAFIKNLADYLRGVGGEGLTLGYLAATELGVIGSFPAWAQVQGALTRLQAAGNVSSGALPDEERILDEYVDMLARYAPNISLALIAAACLDAAVPDNDARQRILRAMEVASQWCNLRGQSPAKGVAALQAVLEGALPSPVDMRPLTPAGFNTWREAVEHAMAAARAASIADTVPAARDAAWSSWQRRLTQHLVGTAGEFVPTRADLLCAAANVTPSRLLQPAVASLSLRTWSDILRRALRGGPPTADEHVPLWMAAFAAAMIRLPGAASALDRLSASTAGEAGLRQLRALLDDRSLRSRLEISADFALLAVRDEHGPPDAWRATPTTGGLVLNLPALAAFGKDFGPLAATMVEAAGFVAVQRAPSDKVDDAAIASLHRRRVDFVLDQGMLFGTSPPQIVFDLDLESFYARAEAALELAPKA